MAERLFQGQIRPAAQPLGAFISPSKNNIAGAARPSQMPAASRIATLQQAGTSSVAGFNQLEQLATSLAPFSKQLSGVVNKGFRQYAIGNIEAGYYDTLRNDEVKARLRAQENKELGAADAANTIGRLERVDPVAGQLARETNPWRAVGRNRALAQLAASEIPAAFAEELYGNQGELSGLKPGSPELRQKKVDITEKINQRYGLSKDELEYTYYVTPQVNKTWDKFTQEQSKLYNEELSYSTRALGAQTINAWFEQIQRDGGINDGAGFVLGPGGSIPIGGEVFTYGSLGAKGLTERIEKTLSLLGGKDKVEAWKQLRGILTTYRAQDPALFGQIVNEVRVGPAVDPVTGKRIPYAERATFAQTYPLELQENSNAFLQAQNEGIQQQQASIKNGLKSLWYSGTGPGSFLPGTEAYQKALLNWQAEATRRGYQDRDGLADTLNKDAAAATQAREQPTVEEVLNNNQSLSNITPEQVSTDEGVAQLRQKARQMAIQESYGNAEEAESRSNYYNGLIDDAIKKQGKLPQGIDRASTFTGWVREDVAGPSFKAKAAEGLGKFNLQTGQGQTLEAALMNSNMESPQKAAALSFASQARALYARKFDDLRKQWWTENPNAPEMTPTAALNLMDKAKAEVRASQDYQDAMANAIKAAKAKPEEKDKDESPAGPTAGDPESEDETKQKPRYGKNDSADISRETARDYQARLVISGQWLRDELVLITQKGYASAEMNALANKAGTSSLVFLRRQLDQVQVPAGSPQEKLILEYMKRLDKRIRNDQSSALPVQTNYQYAMQPSPANYNSRAPGAWLMAELFPSAA